MSNPFDVPAEVTERMRAVRRRDTKPEMQLRRLLHARGRRFFVDRAVVKGLRSRPDLIFSKARLAVYVDGCFWHSCPVHASFPKTNADWWREKLAGNAERDERATGTLIANQWTVLRIWEHCGAIEAADSVERVLASLTSTSVDRSNIAFGTAARVFWPHQLPSN